MLHRLMDQASEAEADPDLVNTAPDRLGGECDVDAQRLEHIRRTALAARLPVPMLGDWDSRSGGDNGGSCTDVEGVELIAAGATRIE